MEEIREELMAERERNVKEREDRWNRWSAEREKNEVKDSEERGTDMMKLVTIQKELEEIREELMEERERNVKERENRQEGTLLKELEIIREELRDN